MLTRRSLLKGTLKISAALALDSYADCFGEALPPQTLVRSSSSPVKIQSNFIGLGYEMSSVAAVGLLSRDNRRYVNLIHGLGPEGVIRVGGIVANYTRYQPNGTTRAEPLNTVITRESLEQFAKFLNRIGWTAIWSVNFAQGGLENAILEARAVASVLGPRLLALELGNEVEFYGSGDKSFRKPTYNFDDYLAEFKEWRSAILKAVPGVRFAAPDTATSVEWVERMASEARDYVQLLTTHYYRDAQSHGTIEQLLVPDPRLKEVLIRLRAASNKSGIPWRLCETNSFSGGGRPSISDTFVGTLWTLDLMCLIAVYGCSGVNIETGVNQLGFVSSYSPIQDNGQGINTAGAPYYGMLAFAMARQGCTEAMMLDAPGTAKNVTAYAFGNSGRVHSAVVINRDEKDARISVAELDMERGLSAMRLLAPAVGSKTGLTFAGGGVDANGKWSPIHSEQVPGFEIGVPGMSAVVVRRRPRGV